MTDKLQRLLNAAAHLVNDTMKFNRGLTQLIPNLHRLNVPERVKYKLVSMVHNCLHRKAPQYLMDWTAAFPSLMWPVDSIFLPPNVITWLCCDTISARLQLLIFKYVDSSFLVSCLAVSFFFLFFFPQHHSFQYIMQQSIVP